VLLANPISPDTLLSGSTALLVLAIVLFAECGLLIGFFLPGDTLLFIAGLSLASAAAGGQGIHINLVLFIGLLWAAAFIGNVVGYWIGYKIGPAVFSRPDAKFLKPEYIHKSEAFFAKYGKVTVVLARFVPVVRTVATVMAGASKMNAKIYTLYSAIGAVLWITSVTVAGFFLGQIAFIRDNLDLIVIAAVVIVICVSAFPAVAHWVVRRRESRQAAHEGPPPAQQPNPIEQPAAE